MAPFYPKKMVARQQQKVFRALNPTDSTTPLIFEGVSFPSVTLYAYTKTLPASIPAGPLLAHLGKTCNGAGPSHHNDGACRQYNFYLFIKKQTIIENHDLNTMN